MVRPLRIEYNDAYYHVMNRGRGRQFIFHDDRYYQSFVDCLAAAHQRFGLEIHAYCLMGSHYHLLVKTPRGNLGRAMRHINGVYTQRYNFLKNTDGALFRGRYKAILIEASSYLLEVSRYIHRNPVEVSKPLVENLTDYRWSSYPAYMSKASTPDWLVKDEVFGVLGVLHRVPAYQRFVSRGLGEETESFYARDVWPAVRGGEGFAEIAYTKALSHSREIAKVGNRALISSKQIVDTVAMAFECKSRDIRHSRRGGWQLNLPRWIAMKLCQDLSGQNLGKIAAYFNVGHYSTVSQTIRRLNELMDEDSTQAENYRALLRKLST